MNKFNPKVSIIIPVYNGANFLKEAIDSALAQTYENIEIVVINDGSNDKGATEKIAKSYGDKIRYFAKENGGVATALNLGIKKMTGEYFSWLSHDDKYKPDRTKKMILRLSGEVSKADLVVASSFTYFVDKTEFTPLRPANPAPSHPLSYLFLGYINGCAILVPKKVIMKVGLFDEKLPTTQDFDYWFRVLRHNPLVYLEEELTLSRSHGDQGSKVMIAAHITECDDLWINITRALSKTEKIKIFGDEIEFYRVIHNFLKSNTLYAGAIVYMKAQEFALIRQKGLHSSAMPDFIDDCSINVAKDKKTIFFPLIGYFSDRGGLNKMVAMLANRLADSYNVIIAAFTDKTDGYELSKKITYIRMSTDFLSVDSIENIAMLFDVDVTVVSHNCSTQGLDVIDRIKALNKSVVAWNHEDYFLPYTHPKFSAIWHLRNTVFSKADAVVWLTDSSSAMYSLSASNGLALPNFIHFDNSAISKTSVRIHNNIIAIARFDDPRKRINLLIKTYEKILWNKKNITLTILGSIDYEMLYSGTETIGDAITRINSIQENIKTEGFVKNIEQYYIRSDINILSSYGEGFGLTILESALYGVPTAVFNNSGFADIINDGENGIIAPEADVDIMAQRIIKLYDNPPALIKMKKASKNILIKFDENKIIERWEDLIHRIIYKKVIRFSEYKQDDKMSRKTFYGFDGALSKFPQNFNYEHFSKLDEENNKLTEENTELAIINNTLNEELEGVYNSKRWKYAARIATFKGRLLK